MDSKKCSCCKHKKALNKFGKKKTSRDGRQSRCLDCQSNYSKQHYQNNKEKYLEKSQNHRRKMQEMVRKIKDVPCKDCKGEYHWCVMDFDHKENKEMNVSVMVRNAMSKEDIMKEISKCDIVCSNCHRMRTYNRLSVA